MAEVRGTWAGEGSGPWNGNWDDSNLVTLNRELLAEILKVEYANEQIYTRLALVDDQITAIAEDLAEFFAIWAGDTEAK